MSISVTLPTVGGSSGTWGTTVNTALTALSAASTDAQVATAIATAAVEAVNTVATSGSAQTLPDPVTYPIDYVTLTANCTFTMPAAVAGKSFTLYCVQDGTGSRTATFTSVRWAGGTAPTLSTAAGKVDVFSFLCVDGTHWDGFIAGQAMA